MTFYYDPSIDHHHRLPVGFVGLFTAYYLATLEPDDARMIFDAVAARAGQGPRGTAMTLHLAREWGLHDIAEIVNASADERLQPQPDPHLGEFTWGFNLNEEHPRGQYNAAMAAAEAMSEGAWSRLARVTSIERFAQPTVEGVDYPDVVLRQAWWDAEQRQLIVETDARPAAEHGQPTTFRVTNLGDPARWHVTERDSSRPVTRRVVDGDALEVETTIGAHALVVSDAAH